MYPTRQLWAIAALGAFLAGLAVVLARPLLLAGTILIGAWMLASQQSFLSALERAGRSLTLTRSPAATTVRSHDTVPVAIAVELAEPVSLQLTVTPGLPTAATLSDRKRFPISLEPGTTENKQTVSVTWPISGRHRFGSARLTMTDGLFGESLRVGAQRAITVEPRGPRNVHVGSGGDRVATTYGEHKSNQSGRGIEPAEIREYMPGDAANRIDWNATARLQTPHVREYDTNIDRRTLLVIDHRACLSCGPPAETKLDYLREVALATARSAHNLGDPLGFLAIGDEGTTTHHGPTGTPTTHATIRRELLELEPTTETQHDVGLGENTFGNAPPTDRKPTLSGARRSAADLQDDSPFAEALRPFYSNQQSYHRYIEEDPLFGAIRTALAPSSDVLWTVIFTDDSSPSELRETISFIGQTGGDVTVFLTPTVLYEPDGLADLEQAYNRYLEFEALRRDLARMDHVVALEVSPSDRLSTILEAGRKRGGKW